MRFHIQHLFRHSEFNTNDTDEADCFARLDCYTVFDNLLHEYL